MSFQGTVEINCPSCTDGFDAPVWSFVHGGTDAALRDQIKARECNLLLCPSCGLAFMPEASWIYYEPDAEIMAFVFPEAWRKEEETWREKMKADFAQMKTVLGARLPSDMEPMVFFGQDDHVRLFGANIAEHFTACGLQGRLYPHRSVLPDIDASTCGCNALEPLFLFSKTRWLTSAS